jgi:hypothetical protein
MFEVTEEFGPLIFTGMTFVLGTVLWGALIAL